MKRKIRNFRREASHDKTEDRNGTEPPGESAENNTAPKDEGGSRKNRRMRVRRRKNEANGSTEREEEDDEGKYTRDIQYKDNTRHRVSLSCSKRTKSKGDVLCKA